MVTVTPEMAAKALVARDELQVQARALEEARIRELLPVVGERLRREFGASEVLLFGSFVWGDTHAGSDVDLAVSGIAPAELGIATAACEQLLHRAVELFELHRLPPDFRARVVAEGRRLP